MRAPLRGGEWNPLRGSQMGTFMGRAPTKVVPMKDDPIIVVVWCLLHLNGERLGMPPSKGGRF